MRLTKLNTCAVQPHQKQQEGEYEQHVSRAEQVRSQQHQSHPPLAQWFAFIQVNVLPNRC
jgi:hypothetical protein